MMAGAPAPIRLWTWVGAAARVFRLGCASPIRELEGPILPDGRVRPDELLVLLRCPLYYPSFRFVPSDSLRGFFSLELAQPPKSSKRDDLAAEMAIFTTGIHSGQKLGLAFCKRIGVTGTLPQAAAHSKLPTRATPGHH